MNLSIDDLVERYIAAQPQLRYHGQRNQRASVRRWQRFGLPTEVTVWTEQHFAQFRAAAVLVLKPRTVEDTVSRLRTLLRFAGPRSHANPHGKGLIADIPYTGRKLAVRPVVAPIPSLDDVSALYRIAEQARYPQRDSATTMLRAMLVVVFNTGLRYGDLTQALRWDCYDERDRVITLQASKTGKVHCLPVNDIMAVHLATLPRTDGRIFAIPPRCDHYLRQELKRLCALAGVRYFAWQAMRRRAATSIELVHPGAGGLLLGHTLSGMTFQHYIDPLTILRPANAKVEQPQAFVQAAKKLSRRKRR